MLKSMRAKIQVMRWWVFPVFIIGAFMAGYSVGKDSIPLPQPAEPAVICDDRSINRAEFERMFVECAHMAIKCADGLSRNRTQIELYEDELAALKATL